MQLASEQPPEQRARVHARKVILPRPLMGLGVIAEFWMIEARFHVFGKRDGPARPNSFGKNRRERSWFGAALHQFCRCGLRTNISMMYSCKKSSSCFLNVQGNYACSLSRGRIKK